MYPNFEQDRKDKLLPHYGWGLTEKKLKYKTAYPQKGKSVDRKHLKYFDTTKPSKFKGYPAGFNEPDPEIMVDMNPEVYRINYPSESRIPLGSLEMSR